MITISPALRVRTGSRFALAGVLAILGALLGLVMLAGPAAAHASLVGTDPNEGQVLPSAPRSAHFTFDEPVRIQSGAVHVFDATGTELDAEAHTADSVLTVDLPSSMHEGTYIVAWRIISADGHPVSGALRFSVGAPSKTVASSATAPRASPATVDAVLGVVQGVRYLGAFAAVGLVCFLLLLLPRAPGLEQVRRRVGRAARGSAWVAAGAAAVLLPLTELRQRGEGFSGLGDPEPWTDPLLRAEGLSSLLLIIGVLVASRMIGRKPLALAAACLALASLALVGHTRSTEPMALVVVADLAHVAAGSAWVGGLIGLVLTLPRLAGRPALAADVLARFSGVAAWLLGLVALTGSILAWRILRTWSAVVETDFGRVLLIKVAIVVLVAAVAGWNRFRLLPRVAADSGFAEQQRSVHRFRRTVASEAALLVCVLGVTGFLVDRTPVPDQAAIALPGALDDSTFVGQGNGIKVVATVRPATVGRNELLIQVQDGAGEPIEPYADPEVSLSEGDVGLGDQRLVNVGSGTYRSTVLIPKPGSWRVAVSVRTSEFDNPVVTLTVPVKAQ